MGSFGPTHVYSRKRAASLPPSLPPSLLNPDSDPLHGWDGKGRREGGRKGGGEGGREEGREGGREGGGGISFSVIVSIKIESE